jgi:hypothetical protein
MTKASNVSSLFVVNWSAFHFPKVVGEDDKGQKMIQDVVFGPGLNEIHDEELLDQMLCHPAVEMHLDCGQLKIYDGRVKSLESDLGLQLTDIKGEESGVPVGEIHEGSPRVKYRKSDNVSGTKTKTTKSEHAHGNQPLPPQS